VAARGQPFQAGDPTTVEIGARAIVLLLSPLLLTGASLLTILHPGRLGFSI
jgi:hypothetical protein